MIESTDSAQNQKNIALQTVGVAGIVPVGVKQPQKAPMVSVVVPVYRSEKTLPELHRRLTASLGSVTPNYEILLIEDSGGDGSWQEIRRLAASDPHVRGVQLTRNFGQHAATICGISRANGDWIVTLDDDLEQQPEFIPGLLAKATDGYALVYGVYPQRSHNWWRNFTSELGRKIFSIAIPSLNYEYTSFRVIERDTAKALVEFDSPFPFVDGYLSWVTNRYATVNVPHGERLHGSSNYTLRTLLKHTINIFVTFSDLPLKFATWLGLGAFIVGAIWLIGIVLGRLLGGITVSGFASVMAGIIAFGGMQLLILGIFGEYLGRMNFKSSKKPLFLVANETTKQAP